MVHPAQGTLSMATRCSFVFVEVNGVEVENTAILAY